MPTTLLPSIGTTVIQSTSAEFIEGDMSTDIFLYVGRIKYDQYIEELDTMQVHTRNHIAYVKYDLTGITGGVTDAKLRVYNYNGSIKIVQNLEVRAVTGAWVASTLRSDNQPTSEATPVTKVITASQAWFDIDVTDIVNRMVTGQLVNNGFKLSTQDLAPASVDDGRALHQYVNKMDAGQSGQSTYPYQTQLVITTGTAPALISNSNIASVSSVSVAFNAIPPLLQLNNIAISAQSTVTVAFVGVISPLEFSVGIQSTSAVNVQLQALTLLTITATIASTSNVMADPRIVLPIYFQLKGNVNLGGNPKQDAIVRAIKDDGTIVFETMTDSAGNYLIEVNSEGTYHLFCYFKDINGNIFSAIAQPFIEVAP